MADSKRKSRKSKLVLRECDVEGDDTRNGNSKACSKIPVKPSSSLLPKLRTEIEKEVTSVPENPVIDISVSVEVEKCLDSDEEDPISWPPPVNFKVPLQQCVIPERTVKNEILRLMDTTTSVADKQIEIEIRNLWGKIILPPQISSHDQLINDALMCWRTWFLQSKVRENILSYKCYLCNKGWWYLSPFRDHIKTHSDIKINIEKLHPECNIVAFSGDVQCESRVVPIDGKCKNCLKTSIEHEKSVFNLKNICDGCNSRVYTCGSLFEHEGRCIKFQNSVFKKETMSDLFVCSVCSTNCLTQSRYDEHMYYKHDVRSDDPMPIAPLKQCVLCGLKYSVHFAHYCLEKTEHAKCKFCIRRFQTTWMVKNHQNTSKSDKTCRACHGHLRKSCMELQCLLCHSHSYMMVFKCLDCKENIMFLNENSAKQHRNIWHNKKFDRRRSGYTFDIVPKELVMKHMQKLDILVTVPGNFKVHESAPSTSEVEEPSLSEATSSQTSLLRRYRRSSTAGKTDRRDSVITQDNAQQFLQQEVSLKQNKNKKNDKPTDKNIAKEKQNIETKNQKQNMEKENQKQSNEKETQKQNQEEQSEDELLCEEEMTCEDEGCLIIDVDTPDDFKIINEVPEIVHDAVDIKEEIIVDESEDDDVVLNQQEDVIINEEDEILREEEDLENMILKTLKREACEVEVKAEPIEIKKEIDDEFKEFEEAEMEILNFTNINIKEEDDDDYVATLSNVFKASENLSGTIVDAASLTTELIVKEEPNLDDHYYEDDIILLNSSDIIEDEEDISIEISTKGQETERSFQDVAMCESVVTDEKTNDINKNDNDNMTVDIKNSYQHNETKLIKRLDKKLLSKFLKNNIKKKQHIATITKENAEIITKVMKSKDSNDELKVKQEKLDDNEENKQKKIYKCKCGYRGIHKDFQEHRALCTLKISYKTKSDDEFVNVARVNELGWIHYPCSKCNGRFSTLRYYLSHLTAHNVRNGACPSCYVLFRPMSKLSDHVISDIKKSFMKVSIIKSETKCVTSKKDSVYKCKMCGEVVLLSRLFTHWERHLEFSDTVETKVPKEEGDNKVALSNISELLPRDVLKVVIADLTCTRTQENDRMRLKKCCVCNRKFFRRNDIKRHLIEHLLKDSYAQYNIRVGLPCQLCDKYFRKPEHYKSHMREHASMPLYKCELCNKMFSDSSNFAKHKKIHNLQVLICDICKKKFHSKPQLEIHMKIHMTRGPSQCPVCSRTFHTESQYKKHYRTKHTKIRYRFGCRLCPAKYESLKQKWDHLWEVHQVRHMEIDCPICDRPFRKFADVRRHMYSDHRVKVGTITSFGSRFKKPS